ncbi:MAG TPA: hypothetical protein VFE25_16055 [Opitutaceae bacterium]|nr:hypothetical protein [Opitutaceae bacterium]
MNSNKNYLLVFLSLVVVGLALVIWSEYTQMVKLRAQLADIDSAALKRELASDKKTIKSLEERLAAMRGRRGGAEGPAEAGEGPGEGGPDRRPGGRFGAFAALSGNPEFQKLLAIQMKGRLGATYGALFKSLNLSPEQLSQFQGLLADKQQAMMDTMQAAREQGINPREDPDGFKALMTQAVAQTDQNIQQMLGDAGFQQYQQYQQTLPERNTVNSLQQSLSYTQTPLTDDESNAMVNLLAQTQPARAGNGTAGATTGTPGPNLMAMMNGGGTAKVTADTIAQASTVLTAPQVSALEQIQQQQQAQQQIQQMMRQANQPPAATTPPKS